MSPCRWRTCESERENEGLRQVRNVEEKRDRPQLLIPMAMAPLFQVGGNNGAFE
jgi:hypothetical protein